MIVLVLAVGFWITSAMAALIFTPDDRPWSFWCTLLLFLGPLGVAVRQRRTRMLRIVQPYGHCGFVLD
ncbi:hypothetical protein [Mycobacterium sp.]|uniref:hypothetical protein n=1 Tax=Mycobacterium sp. TaxID=1785 RepID=UPI003F98E902